MFAYVDGSFVPEGEARVSIFDRGFLFADGVYEVSAVIDGKLVDNDPHLRRLQRSLDELSIRPAAPVSSLVDVQRELISRNELTNGTVYIQITRGAAPRGFGFPKAAASIVAFTQARDIVNLPEAKTGVGLLSVPDLRWKRRDIKTVGLLAQVLAKQAAAEASCQEALLVEDGLITEGASSSFFILTHDDVIVTRSLSNAILAGCTRKAVLDIAGEERLGTEERSIALDEACRAKEAFITSASTFVLPVTHIDRRQIGSGIPGPVAARIRERYIQIALNGQAPRDS